MANAPRRAERDKTTAKQPAKKPAPPPKVDPSLGGAVKAIRDRKKLLDEL